MIVKVIRMTLFRVKLFEYEEIKKRLKFSFKWISNKTCKFLLNFKWMSNKTCKIRLDFKWISNKTCKFSLKF